MRAIALLTALFLFGHAAELSAAHAESAAVVVVGSATPKDRATVASAVRSAARSGSWELVETPFADPEIETLVGCLKVTELWACVEPVTKVHNIQRLIVVRVEPDRAPDGSPAVALTEQILLPGANTTTLDERYCPRCTDETLTRVTFDLTKTLLQEASAGTAHTTLNIHSMPAGAWITLDKVNVGLTNHTYPTFPGHHVVILQREGYKTEIREVDAVENQQATLEVTLHKKGTDDTDDSHDGHPYAMPIAVGAVGVAAFVTGLVLDYSVDSPANGPQPAHLYSGPGIGLMIGGGVAVGVGAYLFVRVLHRASSTSNPTATLTDGGGIIGWARRF